MSCNNMRNTRLKTLRKLEFRSSKLELGKFNERRLVFDEVKRVRSASCGDESVTCSKMGKSSHRLGARQQARQEHATDVAETTFKVEGSAKKAILDVNTKWWVSFVDSRK
ncbi:hypothetical protein KC19_2G150700 [Ceratodon purpureus]|uniref:Uncharacterized protein n=1 Tax=Ceratodon purpureus TaxID=3225 RepID=A0A8T0IVQ3_CERPU|nr:hypothetical protein KC19_2G150700 [Ceratodon purpureus]